MQQDYARPHVARIAMDTMRENNIPILPWPARSSDLSSIEHLWDELGRPVYRSESSSASIVGFFGTTSARNSSSFQAVSSIFPTFET